MTRIVIDTNVLLDGARDEFSAAWLIIQDVIEGKLTAFISHTLEREMRFILNKKMQDQEYYQRIEKFLAAAARVQLTPHGRLVPDDAEDDKVLGTAIDAGAEALITSDKHLLSLDPYHTIRIVSPIQFQNIRRADDSSGWTDFLKQIGIGA